MMFSSRQKKHEWMTTAPPLFWLIFFFLIPTVLVIIIAFRPHDIYGGISDGWTLQNMINLFVQPSLGIVWRTVWVSASATLIIVGLSLPVAFAVAKMRRRIRNLVLLAIVLPFWTSFLVRIFAWKTLLHPEGIIQKVLTSLHLIAPDTILLYNMGAVIFIMVYTYLPFAILPMYAAASKFDFSLMEAAEDLGASRVHAFFRVFIPGIWKGILNATIIVFVPLLGSYVIPDVVGGTNTEMIGNRIGQKFLVSRNLPEASAWSTLLTLGIIIPTAIGLLIHARSKKITAELRNRE